MLLFDQKKVENTLEDYYGKVKISSYLNEEGEQIIHLVCNDLNMDASDINLEKIEPYIKNAIKDEDLLSKMIVIHYIDFYKCYTMDQDFETMRNNFKHLRLVPDKDAKDPYVEALNLKFQPAFVVTSYFQNFHIKLRDDKIEQIDEFLKTLNSDILDVARMNMERGYKYKEMHSEGYPNILTERNKEPITQMLLFPKYMERFFADKESDEFVIRIPNAFHLAYMTYDDFKKDPGKLKDMVTSDQYRPLYYFKKGEGTTILCE